MHKLFSIKPLSIRTAPFSAVGFISIAMNASNFAISNLFSILLIQLSYGGSVS